MLATQHEKKWNLLQLCVGPDVKSKVAAKKWLYIVG